MQRSRQLAWTSAAIAAMSALSAYFELEPRGRLWPEVPLLGAIVCTGPLFGWWSASSRDELLQALPLLLIATVVTIVTALPWVRNPRHTGCLGAAAFLWFFFGWFFAVGMWV